MDAGLIPSHKTISQDNLTGRVRPLLKQRTHAFQAQKGPAHNTQGTTSTQPPSAPQRKYPRSTEVDECPPPSRRAARPTCQPALRDQDLHKPTHEPSSNLTFFQRSFSNALKFSVYRNTSIVYYSGSWKDSKYLALGPEPMRCPSRGLWVDQSYSGQGI